MFQDIEALEKDKLAFLLERNYQKYFIGGARYNKDEVYF